VNSITVEYWYDIPCRYTGHVKFTNGDQAWFKNDELHREDGPAVIWCDGKESWSLNHVSYTKENYYRELHKRGIITEQELFIELL